MPATGFALTEAAASAGVLRAFIGDPFTASGLVALPTEGEIQEPSLQSLNILDAPELTGGAPLSASVVHQAGIVTVPVILPGGADGATLAAMLSATGSASRGHSAPQEPTFTSLVLFPLSEMDQSVDPPTISYAGGPPKVWAPGAPVNARYYWKVLPVFPDLSTAFERNGKRIVNVPFHVFYDFDRPAGHRLVTWGNPATQGITTIEH